MRRRPVAMFGAALLACAAITVSCSGSDDDAVGRACNLIVRSCHAMKNEGDCIDLVGWLDPNCVTCIAGSDCNYFSVCQRDVPGCRLPTEIQP